MSKLADSGVITAFLGVGVVACLSMCIYLLVQLRKNDADRAARVVAIVQNDKSLWDNLTVKNLQCDNVTVSNNVTVDNDLIMGSGGTLHAENATGKFNNLLLGDRLYFNLKGDGARPNISSWSSGLVISGPSTSYTVK